jgi:preprotein translocase subunit SecG
MNERLLTIVLAVQILTALGMIGLILLQHGKGADMGAAFGSGSSGSLFGASGSANFLSRTTAVLAACSSSARWRWLLQAQRAPAGSGSACSSAPPRRARPPASGPAAPDPCRPHRARHRKAGRTTPGGLPRCRLRAPARFPPSDLTLAVALCCGRGLAFRSTLRGCPEGAAFLANRPSSLSGQRSDCRRGEIGRHAILRG